MLKTIVKFYDCFFAHLCTINIINKDGMLKPISEIAPYVPFGKSKTTQLLKKMNKKGIVAVEGKGRGTKYVIK